MVVGLPKYKDHSLRESISNRHFDQAEGSLPIGCHTRPENHVAYLGVALRQPQGAGVDVEASIKDHPKAHASIVGQPRWSRNTLHPTENLPVNNHPVSSLPQQNSSPPSS